MLESLRNLSKGSDYELKDQEFDHWEIFKKSNGSIGRRPVFEDVLWCSRAAYVGKVIGDCRCTACHRRIKRGYRFTGCKTEGEVFTFGHSCIRRRTNPKLLDSEEVRQ